MHDKSSTHQQAGTNRNEKRAEHKAVRRQVSVNILFFIRCMPMHLSRNQNEKEEKKKRNRKWKKKLNPNASEKWAS